MHDELRWYACYTRGRHEKRVAALLVERGIESYLPLLLHERRWRDRTVKVALPAFPSYVFGRFALRDLRRVITTYGVSTVVRINAYPTPIPEAEIEQVRRLIERANISGLEPELEQMVEGERVHIVTGPFKGVEGVIVQRRGRSRVLVGLRTIGQGLSVEIEKRQLRRCKLESA